LGLEINRGEVMLDYRGIQIVWLGHDGFKLKKDVVVYIDPYLLTGTSEQGDLVLVTHEHSDHLSPDDLRKVVGPTTTIVTIPAGEKAVRELKPKAVHLVRAGDRLEIAGVQVDVLSAYNVNKFRSPGTPFHPKADGKVGFILRIGGVRIYHAGDTDSISEMVQAKGVDVAFLPVSGTYVMTAQEAVEACRVIQPKLAIPMHYGTIVGSAEDAETFRREASCRVEILTPES
jgi:L-ascorbate metabolism protein UlaG (beta-lactamase superfamily)